MTKSKYEALVNDILYHVKQIDPQSGGALILTTSECSDSESNQISSVTLHGQNQNISSAMCILAGEDERWKQILISAVVTMYLTDSTFQQQITRIIESMVKK